MGMYSRQLATGFRDYHMIFFFLSLKKNYILILVGNINSYDFTNFEGCMGHWQ